MRSIADNPLDGHTIQKAIQQVSILTDQRPKTVIVDKGYREYQFKKHPNPKLLPTQRYHKSSKEDDLTSQ